MSCEIQWDGVIPRLYVGGCEAMSEERGLLTSQEKKAYLEHYKEADREIDYQVWGQIYGHRPDELERPDTRADGYA